ncbi:MAG: nucleotide exchange factor GrpE, partial [Planctomycetota bacterium]
QNVISLVDHFDLALDVDPEAASAQSVIDGVRLIRDEFLRMIAEHGVTMLSPKAGEAFDPHLHDAIGHEEAADVEPGAVVRTVQPGYMLGERLIRPAKVLVAPRTDDHSEAVKIAVHSDEEEGAAEKKPAS